MGEEHVKALCESAVQSGHTATLWSRNTLWRLSQAVVCVSVCVCVWWFHNKRFDKVLGCRVSHWCCVSAFLWSLDSLFQEVISRGFRSLNYQTSPAPNHSLEEPLSPGSRHQVCILQTKGWLTCVYWCVWVNLMFLTAVMMKFWTFHGALKPNITASLQLMFVAAEQTSLFQHFNFSFLQIWLRCYFPTSSV